MYILKVILPLILILQTIVSYSQSTPDDTLKNQSNIILKNSYPEVKGYVGLVFPIYSISSDGNALNGKTNLVIGNPWGINIWKSKRFGFSFEFTPFIKINNHESKMSNFVFHPGVLYRLGHEYTFIGRVAYETSGRYGFTPILNKVIKRTSSNTLFIAILAPVRFGNGLAPSFTPAFQLGIGF